MCTTGHVHEKFRYCHITKRNLHNPRRRKGRGDENAVVVQAQDQDTKEGKGSKATMEGTALSGGDFTNMYHRNNSRSG